MPVHINEGEKPADGGKPFKHLDYHGRHHQRLIRAGLRSRSIPNPDHKKPLAQYQYRRCLEPTCFGDFDSVMSVVAPLPSWVSDQAGGGLGPWVYVLRDRQAQKVYVGYTSNPARRFKQQWENAHARDGSIGWLHDQLKVDRHWAPKVELRRFDTRV